MAGGDYRSCDNCERKTFYDPGLNYQGGQKDETGKWTYPEPTKMVGVSEPYSLRLEGVGDWAVLCDECAKTFRTLVVPLGESKPICLSCGDADVEMKLTEGSAGLCRACWYAKDEADARIAELEAQRRALIDWLLNEVETKISEYLSLPVASKRDQDQAIKAAECQAAGKAFFRARKKVESFILLRVANS